MSSVGIELPGEIERVSAKRERWRGMQDDPMMALALRPGIALMTIAIEEAKAALANGDAIRAISAYQSLKAFDSED